MAWMRMIGLLGVVFVITHVQSWADASRFPWRDDEIAHRIDRGGISRLPDQVQCTRAQRVGLLVDSVEPVTIDGGTMAVDGCEFGMVVRGGAHTIRGVTVRATATTAIGILLIGDGNGTLIEGGQVSGIGKVGIYVAGDGYLVHAVAVTDNARDGILVLGHGNSVWENRIQRNGWVGLRVASRVAQATPMTFYFTLPEAASFNAIVGNLVTENAMQPPPNETDLYVFPDPCSPPESEDPFTNGNQYEGNTIGTKSHSCLQ